VDKNLDVRLTGPVNHGVLFKVICFAQNPSAAMRGGFLRWGVAINSDRTVGWLSKASPPKRFDAMSCWFCRWARREQRLCPPTKLKFFSGLAYLPLTCG
jgi:hypothetical protein